MSALRLGRLPDGTRHVLILEPAVGRTHFSRLGIAGGGPPLVVVGRLVTGESDHTRARRQSAEYKAREAANQRARRAAK
jgi:hypothetical protein